VPYNFLHKNLVEKVSEHFGVSPPYEYLQKTIPGALNFTLIFVIIGTLNNLNECRYKFQFPHFFMLTLFYIMVFSLIPHKEDRFILPTLPFMIYLAGDYLYKKMKQSGGIIAKVMLLLVLHEIILQMAFYRS
jgi:phosphatidylinositol glycan class B